MSLERRVASLGGLHDARVTAIDWSPAERRLRIVVDDINANTRDLPGYRGESEATLTFSGVTRFAIAADLTVEGLAIGEWTVSRPGPDSYASFVALSPGGRLTIECREVDVAAKTPSQIPDSIDRVSGP